ncbi:MAG TPA: translocation/assembly module TamB domain-containing protein [Devosiaceae bacterium]|nr:translocation/assembly module TamB domain-containing protein [Devosiaceae bacterium]
MIKKLALLLFALALLVAAPLIAQDQQQLNEEEQRNWLVQFVEGRLSTPERQIRLSNIEGILSEDASIREITISDTEGVWLRIVNAAINWNQSALFTGRLEIRSLSAELIEVLRNPVPSDQPDIPAPEAGGLEIPELPVAVILEELTVPRITFGEEVFGLGSEISVGGSLVLEDGNLDADLSITRLDGPGGTLVADVDYRQEQQEIDLSVTLTEPENGILVNLLNVPERPPVALTVSGSGPIADLRTEMTLDAGDVRALAGAATITQVAEGFRVAADLRGPVAQLVQEPYRPFFGAETSLTADALVRQEGGISVDSFTVSGGQLSVTGTAETAEDGFLRQLQFQATVADPAGGAVTLPIPGEPTRVQQARLAVDFGAGDGGDWTGTLAIEELETADFTADVATFAASGVALDLDSAEDRRITFNGDGMISGIDASEPAVQAALGDSIGLGLAGQWSAGEPVELAEFRLAGEAISATLTGVISDFVFDGTAALQTASLEPFAGIAGRDLGGAVDLQAVGTVSPLIGGFDLTLDGTGTDLEVGEDALDAVLAGEVRLSGRLARTEAGIEAENFRVTNPQLTIVADGSFASTAADFDFRLDLADLALLSDEASGPLSVTGRATGTDGPIDVQLVAGVTSGTLVSRPLREAQLALAGTIEGMSFDGRINGSAFLDGHLVSLAAGLTADETQRRLSSLQFETAGTRITGDLAQTEEGLFAGTLELVATDVSNAAALLLQQASGAVDATIQLQAAGTEQSADITATVRDLRVSDVTIGSANVRVSGSDLFGVPMLNGSASARDVAVAGIDLATLEVSAENDGETSDFTANATLRNGTTLAAAGNLAAIDGGYRLALDRAALGQGELTAELAAPTVLAVTDEQVRLDAVRFEVGSGSITATGTAGTALDIAVDINSLPLSVANAVAPELGLAGTLNGNARITGTADDPRASFAVSGSGIGAAAIQPYGVTPLSFEAAGNFADGTVDLDRLSATGTDGLQLAASGSIPLTGGGMSLALTGSAPLALANRLVAERGGQFTGTANLDARLTGSLADPRFSGTVSTSGSGYTDPALNLRLLGITGSASLAGDRLVIDRLTASLATGGTLAVAGSVGLDAANTADLRIRLDSARYADGDLLVATLSGDLAVTGSLTSNPLLSGNVLVEEANITVPETFGGSAALIEVEHVRPAPAVMATLARARINEGGRTGPTSDLQLDVRLNAPNQVFIRGRGLDAELGGSVRLTGSVSSIEPVGAFSLIRGRLSVLGQRLTFESGQATLVGDLDPFIDLVARTEGDGITVFVTVSGRASEPDISFTSNPALPEDEVLSRLIFNRGIGELSPLQVARLAGAAAELAGGGGTSLTESLRSAAGLADLDIVTDESGNIAVQAGQYIQENVYLSVQAGADGQSRVAVDLDITDDLKARASTGVDGESSVGIYYETDY